MQKNPLSLLDLTKFTHICLKPGDPKDYNTHGPFTRPASNYQNDSNNIFKTCNSHFKHVTYMLFKILLV